MMPTDDVRGARPERSGPSVRSDRYRTQQIFEASTLYGAATLAAAVDTGLFGPVGPTAPRRILLLSNNAEIPEAAESMTAMPGFERLAARFDEIVDWNDTVRPHHPGLWQPNTATAAVVERLLRTAWRLGDGPVELVLESVHVPPARTLATIFPDASIHVYADGLMSYGPTRDAQPYAVAGRIRRLVHLDLVPGLKPLLLTEHGVPGAAVPDRAFRAVLREVSAAAAGRPELGAPLRHQPTAVLLGQYLAALGILTPEEEEELHVAMLRGVIAADGGRHRTVLFKPHPTAPAQYGDALEKAAAEAGVRLLVLEGPILAETVYELCRPDLVVGCFSTALLTAATLYCIPVARTGTGVLLERLTPYQNSNRIPVVIADLLLPDLASGTSGSLLADDAAARAFPLLQAVGFCMQSKTLAPAREEVEDWLRDHYGPTTQHYFKRRRLTALDLPGGFGPPARTSRLRRNPTVRKVVRRVRAFQARRAV